MTQCQRTDRRGPCATLLTVSTTVAILQGDPMTTAPSPALPFTYYQWLQRKLAEYRSAHGDLESEESQKLMGSMDETWEKLTEAEKDRAMAKATSHRARKGCRVEAIGPAGDQAPLPQERRRGKSRLPSSLRSGRRSRLGQGRRCRGRVLRLADWILRQLRRKARPSIRGSKHLERPTYSNFAAYTAAILTARQLLISSMPRTRRGRRPPLM